MQSTALSQQGDGAALVVGRAALVAAVLGVALGVWCRRFVEGAGGPFGVSVAELGAPWVLVAFAVGAIVSVRKTGSALEPADVAVGGVAGAAAMVVASFAYYAYPSPAALFWAAAGVWVGAAAGVAGSAWRSRPDSTVEVVAAGVLGLAAAAEGVGRLDYGWFHIAGDLSHLAASALVVVGAALPVLLTRGRVAGFVAACCVLVLAAPVAAVVVVVSHGLELA